MGKHSGPRKGSLGYHPRGKATRIYPKIKSVKDSDTPVIPAFAGYKAGMTHVIATDTYEKSLSYGQKIAVPVTIVECPELFVYGVRVYTKDAYKRLTAFADILHEKLNKDLGRKITLPKKYKKDEAIKKAEEKLSELAEIRLLVHTQPRKVSFKKKPEIFEIPLSTANIEETWKFALEQLGKEIDISSVIGEGDYADVFGITKGKGTQGPVKRFGIKIQPRKAQGHRRFPGSIGAWTPNRVFWTVPMAGQVGFQRRTELNKMIIKIGDDPKEVNPKGGIRGYGTVKGKYILIEGSIPGPKKRMVVIRKALRHNRKATLPSIISVSIESQT